MKFCKKCNQEKEESEFTKKKSSKDGLYCWCRECSRKYQREIDKKPESKKVKRDYYIKNKTKILEYGKEYRSKPGMRYKMTEYQKKYLKTPKGRIYDSLDSHKRRSKAKYAKFTLTVRQWYRILLLQKNKCAICGIEFTKNNKATTDCIIPICLGGGLTFGNTQALCLRCNNKKGSKCDISNAIDNVL